jgi:hypothetical protein
MIHHIISIYLNYIYDGLKHVFTQIACSSASQISIFYRWTKHHLKAMR